MRRKSLRETLAENQRAMDELAKLSGKPTPEGYKELTSHIISGNSEHGTQMHSVRSRNKSRKRK